MAEEQKRGWFKNLFKGGDRHKKIKLAICVILFVVIIAIFMSSIIPKKSEQTSGNAESKSTALSYCHELEDKLVNVLSQVKGIGKVKVFVMVNQSPTYRYLEEGSNQTGENQSVNQFTVYETRNGSNTAPVIVVEELPEILGVLVVATGAKDLKMQNILTNVIANVLSISISKVEVLEGKA